MPIRKMKDLSRINRKDNQYCWKPDVSRPDVAMQRQFGEVLKELLRLCHQYPSGFCMEADDATANKLPTTEESLILQTGDLASSLRSI